MSIQHVITEAWSGASGGLIAKTIAVTGAVEQNLDFTLATTVTTQSEPLSFTRANLMDFYLVADQSITVKTSSPTSPSDTFNLVANQPLVWYSGCGSSAPFVSTTVPAWYFTNNATTVANVSVRTLTT